MGEEEAKTAAQWKDEGNEFYKKGDYRGAIEAYSQAISEAPEDASYYGNRAAAYMMILNYEPAINDCDKAISLNPTMTKAYFRKGKALATLGKFDEALLAYRDGLIHDPNNMQGMAERGEVDTAIKALAKAKELLQQYRQTQTQGGNGNGNGNSVTATRYLTQANALVDAALALASQSFDAKMLKMECMTGLKQYDEAFTYSNNLMRQSPNLAPLLYWRAQCLYMLGNFDSAVKHLQQAVRSDPDNGAYVTLLKKVRALEGKKKEGDEAFKGGRYQAAIDAWTECLAMDPEHKSFNAKLYNNRATAHSKLRQHQNAISDCNHALKLEPGYLKPLKKRAESLYALGGEDNLEQCLRDYEEIARLSPDEEEREYARKIHQTKVALKRAKRKDFYKILNIQQDATEEEIRKAYRKLALKCHPDRHTNSTEEEKVAAEKMFKDVAEAYEVLSDKEKKERYDSGVDLEDLDNPHAHSHGGFGGGFGGGGVDADLLFRMFMAQGGMGGGGMGGGMGGGFRGRGGRGGGGGGGNPFGGGGFHFG